MLNSSNFKCRGYYPKRHSILQRIPTFPMGTSSYWSFFFRCLVHSVLTLLFASRNIPTATSALVQMCAWAHLIHPLELLVSWGLCAWIRIWAWKARLSARMEHDLFGRAGADAGLVREVPVHICGTLH
jgi:hypothetical protein